jgi:PAS domain S-box-containing protein
MDMERSIALLNFALDKVHEAAFLIGEDSRIRYVNEESCRVLGYSREELLNLGVTDIDPDFPIERWSGHWDKLKERGSITFEGRHRTKAGRIFPVEISASYFEFDLQGYNLALVRDITERKRVEDTLRFIAQRGWAGTAGTFLTALAGYLADTLGMDYVLIAHLLDDENGVAETSALYGKGEILPNVRYELKGTPCENVIGRKLCIYPKEVQTLFPSDTLLVEMGAESYAGIPLWDSAGRPIGLLAALDGKPFHDESMLSHILQLAATSAAAALERKRSEEKLYRATEMWERTFNAVPDLIAIIDKEFRIVQANRAMAERLGAEPTECIGQLCYKAIHKTEDPPSYCPHVQTLEDCHGHMAEVSEESLGGDFIVTTSPIFDAAGELHGSVHVARDITSVRKAEEDRKILEAQLHQAQKMEAVGQLAGGIAHDFNNILTAITGYSSMILMRMDKTSPLRHYVEQVLSSAERAVELTKGLLAFSRRQVLNAKPIELCEVVQGLKEMLRRLVPEDIDFRTTVADSDLVVMADKGQIEQVLMNLVTNAKDSMPRGGTLTIEVSPSVMEERFLHAHGFGAPGDYACISVSDAGCGMDEETRKRIFEPFFTTKEVGKGTGLGMAIIYGIIKQHNGYISVYSERGKGTTFKIYLPLISDGIREERWAPESEPAPGGTETVLLAEDDEAVRELHMAILEEAGYRVIEAVDGGDALEKFTEHMAEVDMLSTDVIMPRMNGKLLYEEIRKVRPDMKVLFMSGYTKDIIVERGIIDDEYCVVTKPVTSRKLLTRIREILDSD